METWSRLRRLVLVVLAAAALCGCAQTHDEVNVGIGSAAFSVSPARPYAELYLPYAQMSALAYAQSSDVRGCPIANATRAPWLKELHGKGWHCVFGSAAFNVCPPGRQCGGGLTFHVWRKSDCAQIAIAFRGTDPNDIEDWLSNFRWFIPHRTWDEYDETKYVQPAVMRRIAALGCRNAPIVATGHSLGGGLAQFMAFLDRRVAYVYAFNSSPVTAYLEAPRDTIVATVKRLGIDRVYEAGEVLALPRTLVSGLFPAAPCRPYVRTIRFDLAEGGGLLAHHSIDNLTKGIERLAKTGGRTPLPAGFRAAATCKLDIVSPGG